MIKNLKFFVLVFVTILAVGTIAFGLSNEDTSWNENDKSSILTLSNNNLVVSGLGTGIGSVRATKGVSDGKHYWELTMLEADHVLIGVGNSSYSLDLYPGSGEGSIGYYSFDGELYDGITRKSFGSSYKKGDVIGIALNADALTLEYFLNGTLQGKVNLVGKVDKPFYPMVGNGSSAENQNMSVKANFGTEDFKYPVPEGFKGLDNRIEIGIPTNLKAVQNGMSVQLSWDTVPDATGYKIMRASTQGGPYDVVAVVGPTNVYVDTAVSNHQTYYYVVTAIVNDQESKYSNEVSLSILSDNQEKVTLRISLTGEIIKEFNLTLSDVTRFIEWYNSSSINNNRLYLFEEKTLEKPFSSKKSYLSYHHIIFFEVIQY